jgi:hypothetical protein
MSTELGDDRLLVALDVERGEQALELAEALRGVVGGVKVGSRLFTLEGPALVRALVDAGARVFLDLKFHDIPNTVAQAVESAVHTGAWMVNVHASGGIPMMQAAARAGREAAARACRPAPLLIAVTVLTSMDDDNDAGCGTRWCRGVAAGNRGDSRGVRSGIHHRHTRHPWRGGRSGPQRPDPDHGSSGGRHRRRELSGGGEADHRRPQSPGGGEIHCQRDEAGLESPLPRQRRYLAVITKWPRRFLM